MPLINWSESLSVKIKSIDDQHIKLVEMVNKLHEAMSKGAANSIMGTIFNEMVAYTVTHFAVEEKYFEQYNYPQKIQHKNEHAALITKATALQNDFKSGKLTVSVDVLNFLKEWLSSHIMGSDKQYSAFLIEKGVK